MTLEAYIGTLSAVLFFLVGIAGMFSHWLKRWIRAEKKMGFFHYLFTKNSRYTKYAFVSYVGVFGGLTQIGIVDYASSESLILVFLAGYNIDSVVNKDVGRGKANESILKEFEQG